MTIRAASLGSITEPLEYEGTQNVRRLLLREMPGLDGRETVGPGNVVAAPAAARAQQHGIENPVDVQDIGLDRF